MSYKTHLLKFKNMFFDLVYISFALRKSIIKAYAKEGHSDGKSKLQESSIDFR